MPSRKRTLREISILFTIPIEITAMMETAGITILLKMALPAVVPIPPEKPDASFSTKRKKKEVNTSGIELAMAFIVAPLTPSERLRPTYSEATIKPSPARQITRQHNAIIIRGINKPMGISFVLFLPNRGQKIKDRIIYPQDYLNMWTFYSNYFLFSCNLISCVIGLIRAYKHLFVTVLKN